MSAGGLDADRALAVYREEEWRSRNSHPWEGPLGHEYRALGEAARRLGVSEAELRTALAGRR